MHRSGPLTACTHRLRRWLPTLTIVWALAATVAVLQPCRGAFAVEPPHAHGVQIASDAHPHRHAQAAGGHHHGTSACQCAKLAPPFSAAALDGPVLPTAADNTTPASEALGRARTARHPVQSDSDPATDPATYLTTRRLRI